MLILAFFQGLSYLLLLPPWQHYDEPAHFEYVWLTANRPYLPRPGDEDPILRRAMAASMLSHNFYWNLPKPDLDNPQTIWLGYSTLHNPPGYYLLASLPLRFLKFKEITTQLYVVRFISLLLFVATIGISVGIMRDLFLQKHPFQQFIPLAILLTPPFADLMTAVNSDVGAVTLGTLLLWGLIRLLRFGLNWRRFGWVLLTSLLILTTKNTATVLIVLLPLTFLLGLWQQKRWLWRWFWVSLVSGISFILFCTLNWGDSACWYRWQGANNQELATQISLSDAPFGSHAFTLTAKPGDSQRSLLNPLLTEDVWRSAGQTVTLGGWVWANRPTQIPALGLAWGDSLAIISGLTTQPLTLTTKPTFVAWHFNVPPQTQALHYVFSLPPQSAPLQIFLDGAVLALGEFSLTQSPIFANSKAQNGTWGGQSFQNLVRNASAEQASPRFRLWIIPNLPNRFSLGWGRTPAQIMAALWDSERLFGILKRDVGFIPLDGLISRFAWGHVQLPNPLWVTGFHLFGFLAFCGLLKWFYTLRPSNSTISLPNLTILALAGLLTWLSTALRTIPQLDEGYAIPVTRYTFPAILPTILALSGGWWALWPAKIRRSMLMLLLVCLIVLNFVAILTIWQFYHALAQGIK